MNTGSTITGLHCGWCDKKYGPGQVLNLCTCGKPLLVDYDLKSAATMLTRETMAERNGGMWKYREVLPLLDDRHMLYLGEGDTPLHRSRSIGQELGLSQLFFKDESVNPTGSFKARGLSMAVSMAHELGLKKLIIPTAGNAGSALAAYCAAAGIESCVIMPEDSPSPFKIDGRIHGARIEYVDGTIADCGKRAAQLAEEEGWFSVATLKEPYRIEGKKTMGYELAEQFDYSLPDVIVYPTGGGTGLIGMWKAFAELEEMGLFGSFRPRMVSVQTEGCAPITRAFEQGVELAEAWEGATTCASGIRVPSAVGDFLILRAVRESGGEAISVTEQAMLDFTHLLASKEGIFAAPEAGATLAAVAKLTESGFICPDDRVVSFITGSGYKYLDVFEGPA